MLSNEVDPVHFANVISKILKCSAEIEKAKVRTIKIKGQPQLVLIPGRTSKQFCQAINMNNKQCQCRAVCGKFCKKHKVEEISEPKILIDFSDSED